MGQKYLRMEDRKPEAYRLVRKQNVAKGGGLEPKVNVFKVCVKFYCGGMVKKLIQLNRITDGYLGRILQPPEAMGDFLKIFVIFEKKIAISMPFRSHFARF